MDVVARTSDYWGGSGSGMGSSGRGQGAGRLGAWVCGEEVGWL